jgi:hypothetical protein
VDENCSSCPVDCGPCGGGGGGGGNPECQSDSDCGFGYCDRGCCYGDDGEVLRIECLEAN